MRIKGFTGKLKIGEDVSEMLKSAAEAANQKELKTAIKHCEDKGDYISREMLEDILEDTEEHIDWIESQFTLIGQVGLQNYLQEQIYKGEDS